jgi:hypothetical protein
MIKLITRWGLVAIAIAMSGSCNYEAPERNSRSSVTVQLPAPKPYIPALPTPGFSQPIQDDFVEPTAAEPLGENVE